MCIDLGICKQKMKNTRHSFIGKRYASHGTPLVPVPPQVHSTSPSRLRWSQLSRDRGQNALQGTPRSRQLRHVPPQLRPSLPILPLDLCKGDGRKCKHVRQPVWRFGVVVRQIPHVALEIGKGRLNERQIGRKGRHAKKQDTVQRQDLVRKRIVNRDVVVKKHTIRRLVCPASPQNVPVHPPGQSCAESDSIVTGLRRRHLVDSQLQNPGVVRYSDNWREALAGTGIGGEGFEQLAGQGSAPRSNHLRPVNVRFVRDNDASVWDMSREPTVSNNQRQAALACQSFHFVDREANQT